jgi:hypothetical protein
MRSRADAGVAPLERTPLGAEAPIEPMLNVTAVMLLSS